MPPGDLKGKLWLGESQGETSISWLSNGKLTPIFAKITTPSDWPDFDAFQT